MRIIDVPIEPLEERYSANWHRWFESEYKRLGAEFFRIHPKPLSDKIVSGRFLDICGTNHYKAMQLAMICELAYNNCFTEHDVFLIHDYWFPGIEMLAYIRDAKKINFKICGLLHAGTYDETDFITQCGMGYWGEHLENAWLRICDRIFLQIDWHKRLICSKRDVDPKKLIITGHPTFYEQTPIYTHGKATFPNMEKEKIVVFPHRLDKEKNPDKFDHLATIIKKEFPDWRFVKTKEETSTKQEYYDLLERSSIAISYADQENWGNAMQEALFARCFPVVPDRIAYAEMYKPCFKFTSFEESVSIVRNLITALTGDDRNPQYLSYLSYRDSNRLELLLAGSMAIENMVKEMNKL